jgi:hypothetical protein
MTKAAHLRGRALAFGKIEDRNVVQHLACLGVPRYCVHRVWTRLGQDAGEDNEARIVSAAEPAMVPI